MLTIKILGQESYNEITQEFVYPESFDLKLEHSLAALSKWEEKFEKPFLGPGERSNEELFTYIHCMIVKPEDAPYEVVHLLSQENLEEINTYINKKSTATWFNNTKAKKSGEVITAELIMFWMNSFNIDPVHQHDHLNRLFTLIKIHDEKTKKPEKKSRAEAVRERRDLNAMRRKQLGTSG